MTPILSLTLAPAQDGDEGARGIAQGLAHDGDLLLDQQPGVGGQVGGDAGGGGVRAMHGAEGVGDVDLGHAGKLLGELGVVLLLALVEAEVLKQHDLARLQRGGLGLGVLADDVGAMTTSMPSSSARRLATGLRLSFSFHSPLACPGGSRRSRRRRSQAGT